MSSLTRVVTRLTVIHLSNHLSNHVVAVNVAVFQLQRQRVVSSSTFQCRCRRHKLLCQGTTIIRVHCPFNSLHALPLITTIGKALQQQPHLPLIHLSISGRSLQLCTYPPFKTVSPYCTTNWSRLSSVKGLFSNKPMNVQPVCCAAGVWLQLSLCSLF